jgi:GT2 family glycosyltransferase
VIPNLNGIDRLDGVLGSLVAQRCRDFEAIVIDNGSTDGSVEHLRERWPDVGIVEWPENRGFAAAVNAGFGAGCGELVALVNNDVELDPLWLETSIAAIEARPRAASVASRLLEWDRRNMLDGTGDLVGWDGYCMRRGQGEKDVGQYSEPGPVVSACAAAALYRRAAFEDVGPFDETFFAYVEDIDWGLRAQLAGWECFYEPAAVAYHAGGATSAGMNGFELFHNHRNSIAMMIKNFPLPVLALAIPWALGRRAGSLFKAAARGEAQVLLRAWGAAARAIPSYLRARAEVQGRRRSAYLHLVRTLRPAYRPHPLGLGSLIYRR